MPQPPVFPVLLRCLAAEHAISRGRCCRVCLGRYTGWCRKIQKKQCVTLSSFLVLHSCHFFLSFLSLFCFFLVPVLFLSFPFFVSLLSLFLFLSYPCFVSFLFLFCFFLIHFYLFLIHVLLLCYPFFVSFCWGFTSAGAAYGFLWTFVCLFVCLFALFL